MNCTFVEWGVIAANVVMLVWNGLEFQWLMRKHRSADSILKQAQKNLLKAEEIMRRAP